MKTGNLLGGSAVVPKRTWDLLSEFRFCFHSELYDIKLVTEVL